MKRKEPARVAKKRPVVEAAEPVAADSGAGQVVVRPDGYHWVARDGKQEFGPFSTIEEAEAGMDAGADEEGEALEPESLPDIERDIGIADWIDPDTGAPAEGQSPPHLEQE